MRTLMVIGTGGASLALMLLFAVMGRQSQDAREYFLRTSPPVTIVFKNGQTTKCEHYFVDEWNGDVECMQKDGVIVFSWHHVSALKRGKK